MPQANKTYSVMVIGNTVNSHQSFLDKLTISSNLQEVDSENGGDVIIAFVPVVSRAGTDISAALEKIPKGKPVILMVLHHTYDQNAIVPDSRLCVNREDVFAVDCLFHEDQGLLDCLRNDKAIRAMKKHLKKFEVGDDYWRTPWIAVCIFLGIMLISCFVVGVSVGIVVYKCTENVDWSIFYGLIAGFTAGIIMCVIALVWIIVDVCRRHNLCIF